MLVFSQIWFQLFVLLEQLFLAYIGLLVLIYAARLINATLTNWRYKIRHSRKLDGYQQLSNSPLSYGISIIAPAYNESATIIDNARSLLSLEYRTYEVIIVNDGSKDDSITKLRREFNLEKVKLKRCAQLKTKPIKGIYRSKLAVYDKLVVIDKENGGKSDALNVGLMYAKYRIVGCMDVDSILTHDALQKLVKPFLVDKTVISTGSSIRIANNCKIENGHLRKVVLPKNLFEGFQVLEYLRAFLLGRMSLSGINGLLLVSGASGLFLKRLALKVGGYRTDIVGEDIELIIRMRRYCYENKLKHKVKYIPDPVCWTEAPSDTQTLQKQRNRWSRGSIEALWIHRKIFLNPRFGVIGMYSLPYWLLYEILQPVSIAFGLLFIVGLSLSGLFDLDRFIAMMVLMYSFSIFISTATILLEEITY
ncbi:MAG: glycosyltransferase family 2 protein, partial [Ekhidna sp.]|nr:glycosyltransferase family 2 protein [Ekhidna sp.]